MNVWIILLIWNLGWFSACVWLKICEIMSYKTAYKKKDKEVENNG